MGSPDFSVPCLQALIASEHEVVAIYCQPPRAAGRGQKLRPTAVQKVAEEHGITVHYPTSLKSAQEQEILANYEADAAIVAAYGLLLPQAILDAPKRGCINVHPSKLPRWRGAAPLHRTIMAGDTETALCIMQMNAGLDTGDILLEQPFTIADGTTTGNLHDAMAKLAGEAVLKVLAENPTAIPQSDQGITYASKIDKAEARIDWSKPAHEVRQHILGLAPFPAAWFEHEGEKIKALDAELSTEISTDYGVPLDDTLTIACGEGSIQLTKLQRAGKKPMSVKDFLRGYPIPTASRVL